MMATSTILLYIGLLFIATITGPIIWNSIISGFIFGLLLIAGLFSYSLENWIFTLIFALFLFHFTVRRLP